MVLALSQSISTMQLPADNLELWLEKISVGRSEDELNQIRNAALFAIDAHQGQKRVSGEDYVNHTFAVAAITHELGLDSDVVIASLLHDTVEDTEVTLADIKHQFGEQVMRLVDGVTKMEVIQDLADGDQSSHKQRVKAESLRKVMLAMVEDVRVVLIKLCDRLHNMRTLDVMRSEKQKRVALETLDIFSPLANRLGVWQLKWELEDLSFRYLEPQIYSSIAKKCADRRVDREKYIHSFIDEIKTKMEFGGLNVQVTGRVKHIYSIWSKMRKKGLDFEQLYDVRAVRILVDSVQACYTTLGILHTNWKYIAGEFDDYIAIPKENNYRSIHTAVIGTNGQIVEVQIRTHEMHEYNELGIAAHWRYKEGNKDNDEAINNKILWLRQLLEWKDQVTDAKEFVDRVKDEVFEDRVYVFSPNGKVIDLAHGSTPIDFAYAIHTEIGHRCRGATVNKKMVPLTYKLKTGEQVKIITAKEGGPSLDWLDSHKGYIRSRRARSGVQHWFRHKNRDETIAYGRTLLEKEFDRMNLNGVNIDLLAKKMDLHDTDEIFFKMADGSLRPGRVASMAQLLLNADIPDSDQKSFDFKVAPKAANDDKKPTDIRIHGVSNLLTNLAPCCEPVLGDTILGFITRGEGITIHRASCPNMLYQQSASQERVVELDWGQQVESTFSMTIQIQAFDRKGLLKDVSTVFADESVNVVDLRTQQKDQEQTVLIVVTVDVPNLEVMSKLLAKLDALPNVMSVKRKM